MPGRIAYRVDVDTKGLARGERALRAYRDKAKRSFTDVDRAAAKHKTALKGVAGAVVGVGTAYAALRGGRAFIALTDEAINLRNQIKQATSATGEFSKVNRSLRDIARDTYTPLETNVNLYREIVRLRPELKTVAETELRFVETIGKAAQISGASSVALSNALRQLSQGLAGGILRAEEWNSIIENTPEIANRIAQGMGKTVGELRKMVISGEVLSKDVFQAILSQSEEIDKAFSQLEGTVGRETVNLKNAALDLADAIDARFGVSGTVQYSIKGLTALIEKMTAAARKSAKGLAPGEDVFGGIHDAQYDHAKMLEQKANQQTPIDLNLREAASKKENAQATIELSNTEITHLELVNQAMLDSYNRRIEYAKDYFEYIAAAEKEEEERRKRMAESARGIANTFGGIAESYASFFTNIAAQSKDNSKEDFDRYKRFAKAQAVISGSLAALNAVASASKYGPVAGAIAGALVGGLTAAQIAQIDAQQFTPRRMGGRVQKGQGYLVGEAGPELMVPDSAGTVIPNDKVGTQVIINTIEPPAVREDQGKIIIDLLAGRIEEVMAEQAALGG